MELAEVASWFAYDKEGGRPLPITERLARVRAAAESLQKHVLETERRHDVDLSTPIFAAIQRNWLRLGNRGEPGRDQRSLRTRRGRHRLGTSEDPGYLPADRPGSRLFASTQPLQAHAGGRAARPKRRGCQLLPLDSRGTRRDGEAGEVNAGSSPASRQ